MTGCDQAPAADRILKTFLRLVAERGIDATTTRVLAEQAGVNEVTIFRLFGDKASLITEAVRRGQSAALLQGYPLQIDASSPQRAADGVLEILNFLHAGMAERPEFIQFGIAEFWRFPELKAELGATPRAARDLVERALVAAAPVLRPGLDPRAASVSLIGLLFISVVWQSRGWLEQSEADWQAAARQAVECLLKPT
jgi:AcrR family transcriptional regulator